MSPQKPTRPPTSLEIVRDAALEVARHYVVGEGNDRALGEAFGLFASILDRHIPAINAQENSND